MSEWQIGERIADRWEIQDIHQGGFGIVYIVFDHQFRRQLAIKTYKTATPDPVDEAAFVREATTWIRLDHHPNVAQAFFLLRLSKKPHLFLEYVDGGNLRQLISSAGAGIPLHEGLRLAVQICDGLSHIYERGVAAHRDLKPENCLITSDGRLKVTDFGIARLHPSASVIGREGSQTAPAGSAPYMPPEQFRVGSVNKTADVYAFGVILFELLTGIHPFARWLLLDTSWSKWESVQSTVVPDFADPGLPPHLRPVLERCLAKNPKLRYADFGPIRDALAAAYRAVTRLSPSLPTVRPLDGTELGLKAAGLLELRLPAEAAVCLVRILNLDETQEELFSVYERVASLLELFSLNNLGWSSGVGALLLCALAPGRTCIIEPCPGLDEAIQLIENMAKLKPIIPGALEMKARLLLVAGRYEHALTALREAIAVCPDVEPRKTRLTALPRYQAYIWEHELKRQAEAQSHAASCYGLAAELGDAAAQYRLGMMCLRGQGVEQNPCQAYAWLHLAARRGNVEGADALDDVRDFLAQDKFFTVDLRRPSALAQAKHNVGVAYYNGSGTARDYVEALTWFKEAAEMGLADSRYNLGLMYKNGHGMHRDLVQAYFWLYLAAQQGDNDALAMCKSVAASMSSDQCTTAEVMIREYSASASA
jgi:serine/threonine protein kinase